PVLERAQSIEVLKCRSALRHRADPPVGLELAACDADDAKPLRTERLDDDGAGHPADLRLAAEGAMGRAQDPRPLAGLADAGALRTGEAVLPSPGRVGQDVVAALVGHPRRRSSGSRRDGRNGSCEGQGGEREAKAGAWPGRRSIRHRVSFRRGHSGGSAASHCFTVFTPGPPLSRSTPGPPTSESLPGPPVRVSFPASPASLSLPA